MSIVDEVRKALKTPKSLVINRVPPKTREAFIKLAMEEFCDDYGMTLKWLIDVYATILPKIHEVEYRLSLLEEAFKSGNKSSSDDTIVMLDGRVIKKGGDVNG